MTGSARRGFVLVTVLLVSAAVWVLLAGLLVALRLQLAVAVAARDHRVAHHAAVHLVEAARAHPWWDSGPLPTAAGGSDDGTCAWTLSVLDVSSEHAWYEAEVRYGRSVVRLDATAHRAP